jgi:hypothetical protein
MSGVVGWYAERTSHREPCDTWDGEMEETVTEAGHLIAEIATALARDEYQIADLKFKQLSDLVGAKDVEHRTIDLQIMNRIITDVLFPEIQARVPQSS